jgi:Rrf2 family protein
MLYLAVFTIFLNSLNPQIFFSKVLTDSKRGYKGYLLSYLSEKKIKEPMRLTRAAEYAIRCIIYLSRKEGEVSVSKKEIAKHADIPESFLAKIVQDLSRAGFIETSQGSKGGYRLLRNAQDISLLEVVETMVGRIYLNDCITRPDNCLKDPQCLVHKVWDEASAQLRDKLANVNFEELSRETCIVRNFLTDS